MSPPVEDICKDYYAFANCHRFLASHTMERNDGDGNGNGNGNSDGDSKHCNY